MSDGKYFVPTDVGDLSFLNKKDQKEINAFSKEEAHLQFQKFFSLSKRSRIPTDLFKLIFFEKNGVFYPKKPIKNIEEKIENKGISGMYNTYRKAREEGDDDFARKIYVNLYSCLEDL